ncbi:MAG: DUF6491 family protein [Pseudomonadota bacterium]
MKHILGAAVIALFLGACATSEPAETSDEIDLTEDPRVGEQLTRLCFTNGINGFSRSTSRSVVLSRGTKDFLVTTRNRCRDLDGALSLSLDSFSGCLSRGDQLISFDSAFGTNIGGIPAFPCFVDEIYEWDADAEPTEADDTSEENDDAVES